MPKFQLRQPVIYVPEDILTQVSGFVWMQSPEQPPMVGAYELLIGITVPERYLRSVDEDFTHQHIESGNVYRMIREKKCKIKKEWVDAVIYEDEDGLWIVRPTEEFNDGRFEKIK